MRQETGFSIFSYCFLISPTFLQKKKSPKKMIQQYILQIVGLHQGLWLLFCFSHFFNQLHDLSLPPEIRWCFEQIKLRHWTIWLWCNEPETWTQWKFDLHQFGSFFLDFELQTSLQHGHVVLATSGSVWGMEKHNMKKRCGKCIDTCQNLGVALS